MITWKQGSNFHARPNELHQEEKIVRIVSNLDQIEPPESRLLQTIDTQDTR